jgi:tetratricopeptide (TPR) repeat protein
MFSMSRRIVDEVLCGALLVLLLEPSASQQVHNHPVPEKLGIVVFPTNCAPTVQKEFDRAVALLHSFAYSAAESSFEDVAARDPHCAMAHWGIAMANFHQLWDPPFPPDGFSLGQQEIRRAQQIDAPSGREVGLIQALALVYDNAVPYPTRIVRYEAAMQKLAAAYRDDAEAQVFYALALLAAASPFDKTHANQKRAADILEPLYRRYPQHPGIPHYLIHAFDNAELASRGVAVARAYSKIAPSAPHALHMPSHIFTRLGMWSDSIASNRAARVAAHEQGDVGEELHAMDYLVYAYLQEGREQEAAEVIQQLGQMQKLNKGDFKVAYASTAMPVRYAVERHRWTEAASIEPPLGAPPHVAAIAVWARALGLARSGRPAEVSPEIGKLRELERQLQAAGNEYWAQQVRIQIIEAEAWLAQGEGRPDDAQRLLRDAAEEEDSLEKLPVTLGPIIPAREQLGDLLLQQRQPDRAVKEFQNALASAPKRHGSREGLLRAIGRGQCK